VIFPEAYRAIRIAATLLFALGSLAFAQSSESWEVFIPRQVTTHPSDDYEPAVSGDGRFLVFTSDRNGNEDIFLKSTSGGGDSLVTDHTSADYHPSLSPDNETVAYVSRRDDALGDIYLQERSSRKAERLTTYKGYDDQPRFAPDGGAVLFVSDRETGLPNLWLANLEGEASGPLTTWGATDPCWSPDGRSIAFVSLSPEPEKNNRLSLYCFSDSSISILETGPGVDGFPCFLPGGKEIIFSKFGMDTNGDGELTTEDTPYLCRFDLETENLQQLTFSEHWEYMPTCSRTGEEVFYVSNKGGNFDLYAIPPTGVVPRAESGERQLELAGWAERNLLGREAPYLTILAYQAVSGFYPHEGNPCARAGLRLGRLYGELGYPKRAQEVWTQTIKRHPDERTSAGFCEIELVNSRASWFWHLDRRKSLREATEGLEAIKSSYSDNRTILAAALKAEADWLRDYGDLDGALERYQEVTDRFPEQTDLAAEAEFRRAQIRSTTEVGDPFAEVGGFLEVVDRYQGKTPWADSARVAVIGLFQHLEFDKKMAALNKLFYSYREREPLAALALSEMARAFANRDKPSLAIDVYERLISSYPEGGSTLEEAKYELAKLQLGLSQTAEATKLLSELYEKRGEIESAALRYEIEKELFNSLLAEAEGHFTNSDYLEAKRRFEKIISLNYRNVKAHWGWIRSCTALGDLGSCERNYRDRVSLHPNDEVAHYGLGLTLVFKFQKEEKLSDLKSARRELEEVLTKDYGFVEAYLTLGWVYCYLQAQGETEEEESLYEVAIDLSTMGINLNDEAENPSLEADLHLNAAEAFLAIGQNASAVEHYLEKLRIDPRFPDQRTREAVIRNLARAARDADRFDLSAENYRKVLRAAERLQDSELKLQIYEELGLAYHMAGDFERSNEFFSEALEYRRTSGPLKRLAHLHQAMAFNHQMLEETKEAIEHTRIADSLFSSVPKGEDLKKENALKVKTPLFSFKFPFVRLEEIKVGGSLYPRGFPLAAEGWLSTSIESRSESISQNFSESKEALKEKLSRVRREKERGLEAVVLNNIGYQYLLIGEYDSSLTYFSKAWEVSNKEKLLSGMVVNALNFADLGLFLLQQEIEPPRTTVVSPEARIERIESILNQTIDELGPTLTRPRSLLLADLGGLSYLEGLLKMRSQRGDEPVSTLEAFLGGSAPGLGEILEAEKLYLQALDGARESKYWPAIGQISYNLGSIYRLLGRFEAAEAHLRESLKIGSRFLLSPLVWQSEQALALLEWDQNSSPDSVEAHFRKGLEVLENSPVEQEMVLSQPSMGQRKEGFYRDYLSYEIGRGDYRSAFTLLERKRARLVVDLLATYDFAELKRERHKIYLRDARYLQQEIHNTRGRILKEELRGGSADPEKLASLRGELSGWESEHEKLKGKIREEGPELISMIMVDPVKIEELQEVLPRRTALLNYAVLPEVLGIWVVTSDDLRFELIPVREERLSELIESYCPLLRAPPGEGSEAQIKERAKELYSLLIEPIEELIGERDELVIVPDQWLAYLPFSSLLSPDGYLFELFNLTISPSADFYYQSCQRQSPNRRGTYLLPLNSGTEAEIEALKESLLSVRIDSPPPSPGDLKQEIADYGKLHICGGIDLDHGYPLKSRITYRGVGDSIQTIYLHDLYSWDLGASLLSVSENDFGHDPYLPGRGGLALALGLGYAGVPSLVTSLWPVDSRVRGEFFKLLYEALEKYDVSSALGEAQLRLKEEYQEPHFWASFQNVGFGGLDPASARTLASQKLGTLLAKAQGYASQGEWILSAKSYREALNLAYQLELPADRIERLLSGVVLSYFRAGDFANASKWQAELLEMGYRRQNRALVESSLLGLRRISYQSGEYDEASLYESEYRKASIGPGQTGELGVSLRNQADFADLSGEYESARALADSALLLFQSGDDTLNLIQTHLLLGRIEINSGDFNAAVRNLSVAAELSRDENSDVEARSLQLLGFALMKLGDFEKALSAEKRCLELLAGGDNSGEIARTCQYLATIYWYLGDYDRAGEYQKRCWDLYRQLGDGRGRVESLNLRGLVERYTGETKRSFSTNRWGVTLADSLGLTSHKATFLNNLGNLLSQERNYKESLVHYRLAYNLDREAGDSSATLLDLRSIGLSFQGLGDYDSALVYYRKASEEAERQKNLEMQPKLTYHLGHAHLQRGEEKEAEEFLRRARELSDRIALEEISWRAHFRLGELERKRNRIPEAEHLLKRAFEIVSLSLPQDPLEVYKGGYLESDSHLYRALLGLLIDAGKTEEALECAELVRNRSFADRLAQRKIDFKREEDREAFERLQRLKQRVFQEKGTLSSLVAGKSLTELPPEHLEQAVERIREAQSDYGSFFDSLLESDRGFVLFFRGVKPSIQSLSGSLGEDTAMLYYFSTPEALYCWAAAGERIEARRVNITESELKDRIELFRGQIRSLSEVERQARELYGLLVKPLESVIAPKRHLCIIPGGSLFYLPFGVLIDEKGEYLGRRWQLSYLPSISYLGDDHLSTEVLPRRMVYIQDEKPDPLGIVEDRGLLPLLGENGLIRVSASSLPEVLSGPIGYLHLAAPGRLNPERPFDSRLGIVPSTVSFLDLAGSPVTSGLCSWVNIQLPHILSAEGFEVELLWRLLLSFHCRRALLAQWSPEVMGRAVLLKRFYRSVLITGEPESALTSAQQRIEESYNPHPNFWGGYYLLGVR
jgi:tetratricopeptide (TPR) repeat protein/Tol biopolymer transport system component